MNTHLKTKNTSRAVSFLRKCLWVLFISCAILALPGCGDFFSEKATELESKSIIREISKINYTPEINFEIPDIYKTPPIIIEGTVGEKKDAKLFYFTHHHSPADLSKLINEQFIKKFFDAKGKPFPVKDYGVSVNAGANQIIVRCPSVADAEEVKNFLLRVDVPPIQVKIDCIISEVYADQTMDWETTIDIQELFGTDLNLSGKDVDGNILPAFPGAALRDVARSTFGLKAGLVHGNNINALVDLLVSRGYLKILMNPSLEVINGKTAVINAEEKVPMDQIRDVHPNTGLISYTTRYEPVVDSLEITPTVYGDGYIGIKTTAIMGSKSTPEGVKQVPILTKREVRVEENRIRSGESLIIGGITKTEKRSVIRGVPFLKDLPFIGVFFSSKDFEERGKEVLFILTPTISSGGKPNKEVIDKIRAKHEMIKPKNTIMDTINDPFGQNIYADLVEEEATKAQIGRVRAELEKKDAQKKAQWLQMQLEMATQRTSSEDTKSTNQNQIDEWMKKRQKNKGVK